MLIKRKIASWLYKVAVRLAPDVRPAPPYIMDERGGVYFKRKASSVLEIAKQEVEGYKSIDIVKYYKHRINMELSDTVAEQGVRYEVTELPNGNVRITGEIHFYEGKNKH